MNGDPVSGCYYDPEWQKKIWLRVGRKVVGCEWQPSYYIDYGEYVGGAGGTGTPPDWEKWEPYTGQPDRLEQAKIASLVALARMNRPYDPPRSWWRFW